MFLNRVQVINTQFLLKNFHLNCVTFVFSVWRGGWGLCGGAEAGSRKSSKLFPLNLLLSLQPLLCITIFNVRSKGIANRRFTQVYEETFVLLEIPNSYFL